jgi:hypothetical protein
MGPTVHEAVRQITRTRRLLLGRRGSSSSTLAATIRIGGMGTVAGVHLVRVIGKIRSCARTVIPRRMALVVGIVGVALVGMIVVVVVGRRRRRRRRFVGRHGGNCGCCELRRICGTEGESKGLGYERRKSSSWLPNF